MGSVILAAHPRSMMPNQTSSSCATGLMKKSHGKKMNARYADAIISPFIHHGRRLKWVRNQRPITAPALLRATVSGAFDGGKPERATQPENPGHHRAGLDQRDSDRGRVSR